MLRATLRAAQVGVLALIAYDLLTALPGWHTPPPSSRGRRRQRFRVLVPAHDEADVIGGLLDDLRGQAYDPDLIIIEVVADRCTDRTAEIARERGATVLDRSDGVAGKGPALAWALAARPLRDEALVVLDADNRLPGDLFARFADELEAGHHVLQAYLDVANPDRSLLTTASALTYWASNRMVQLARTNLGWSADLGGTGMCLTPRALADAGGFREGPTEDQDLAARLVLSGHRVVWIHDVRVFDEKPAGVGVAVRQRMRWMAGKRQSARRYGTDLLRRSLHTRSLGPADLALRQRRPGRSFVALLSAVVAATAWRTRSRWVLPWPVWTTAAGLQVIAPLPFLARDGVPARYLVRYPAVTLLAALWVPIRVLSRRAAAGWYRTPHRGGRGGRRGGTVVGGSVEGWVCRGRRSALRATSARD